MSTLFAAFLALLSASATAAEAPKVVVTSKPIHSLVSGVMQGVGTPTLLVDGSASPHTFALRPSQVRAIDAADVFFRVSEALEPFTAKIARALPDGVRLVTLADAPGVHLFNRRVGNGFEHHHHDGGEAAEDASEHEDEGPKDGHIWLDPDNAKAIVAAAADALSARDPAHAAAYRDNAARLKTELDALSREISAITAPLARKPFVVFHDAYRYFEKRFGLDAVGSITISPEVQPSAKRLSELRRKISGLHAVCVFAEPLFQPNLVAALTEGTDARPGRLDPEGMTLAPGPDLYATLMRNLASDLKACLAPAT
jgi:zinc transport system substrate-binding protein